MHKSVWQKVTLGEGLRTIGFPERPEVGLHQGVWEKVTLSEGLRLLCQPGAQAAQLSNLLSKSVWANVASKVMASDGVSLKK